MSSKTQINISRHARRSVETLGAMIVAARKERRMSQAELARRLGVSRPTVHAIESGNPSVSIGSVFEAATIVGIPLLADDPRELDQVARSIAAINRVLPRRARRKQREVNDDF